MPDAPRESPTPDVPIDETRSPSGVFRIVDTVSKDFAKAKKMDRYKTYGVVGSILLGMFGVGSGRISGAKAETVETKLARQQEQTAAIKESVEKLTTRVDAGEKETTALKVDVRVVKFQNKLILRALKVDEKLWPKDP